jgi:hypothetical protein
MQSRSWKEMKILNIPKHPVFDLAGTTAATAVRKRNDEQPPVARGFEQQLQASADNPSPARHKTTAVSTVSRCVDV